MNSQQARKKLEALVENSTTGVDIMAAADAYGDARELEGHVAACTVFASVKEGGSIDYGVTCSDGGWYCEEAKRLQGGNA